MKTGNAKNKNIVHGYKVFNPDWTCSPNGNTKQYICPGRFEEEGELDINNHGMHFCQTVADCFNYYDFDSNNKVAEVIAYGKVLTDGDMSCTNKLEIVREIPWDEVLRIVNLGKNCTGRGNSGNWNSGNWNTGYRNTGDCNAIGNWNSGNWNTGSWNVGDWNTGNCNVGNRNAGNNNAGNCNMGNNNAGNCNAGDSNAGDNNAGDNNTGDNNAGDWNTGDWNKSSFNTGCFNTVEQKILLFNKPSDMTYRDWYESDARWLLNRIPKDVVGWICSEDMTDEEKTKHPTHETTGGYLKVLDKSECAQMWWNRLSDNDKNIIKSIPNFDPEIFKQCTGIDVEREK